MLPLPRPASPRALIQDIRAFASERQPHQLIAAAVAVMMPIAIIVLFILDGRTNIKPAPQIIYVESWSADRSNEEIVAQQRINEERRKAAALERQRQYQRLEKQLGM